jgi:ABC-2 type transport system permease protein
MDRGFFKVLKLKSYCWKQEIVLATKNLFYLFPPKLYLPAWIVKTISEIIFFTFLGYAAAGQEGATFAFIGNSVAIVGRSIIGRGTGLIANEKWMGTLTYIVVAPFNYFRFVVGRNVINLLEGFLASVIVFFTVGSILDIFNGNLLIYIWFMPVVLIIALSLIGLSTIIAGITFYARTSMYVSSSIWLLLMIFCGITYPLTILPELMQKIAYFLPTTNGILAIRELTYKGTLNTTFFCYLINELLIGLLYLLIGFFVMKVLIRISLKKGTLDSF